MWIFCIIRKISSSWLNFNEILWESTTLFTTAGSSFVKAAFRSCHGKVSSSACSSCSVMFCSTRIAPLDLSFSSRCMANCLCVGSWSKTVTQRWAISSASLSTVATGIIESLVDTYKFWGLMHLSCGVVCEAGPCSWQPARRRRRTSGSKTSMKL